MPLIHTEIEITAPARRVWELLSDFGRYPEWNPSIARLEGRAQPGARLRLRARVAGVITVPLRPVLLKVDPDLELAWSGGLPILMAGAHRFAIQRVDPDRVLLIHDENFTGWLAPLFALFFGRGLRHAYQRANRNLKALAEQRSEVTVAR